MQNEHRKYTQHILAALLLLQALLTLPALAHDVEQPASRRAEEKPLELLAHGEKLLPPYHGTHRYFLTADEEQRVLQAVQQFSAALRIKDSASLGLPHELRGRRLRSHAYVLLAENAKNRGQVQLGAEFYQKSLDDCDAALTLDANYLFGYYARGIAYLNLAKLQSAIKDFSFATSEANRRLTVDPQSQEPQLVRFQAMQFLAEALIQAHEYQLAVDTIETFYALPELVLQRPAADADKWERIANAWLRAREFNKAVAAIRHYLEINPQSSRYYAELAYIAGLMPSGSLLDAQGKPDDWKIGDYLEAAITRAGEPSSEMLYALLWQSIIDDRQAHREAAVQALREMLEEETGDSDDPPSIASAWDRLLVRYMLGRRPQDKLSEAEFLAAAERELQRRHSAAEHGDDLLQEVWFYVGYQREQVGDVYGAIDAYRTALSLPLESKWKWEWEYARQRYGRVIRLLKFKAAAVNSPAAPLPGSLRRITTPWTAPVSLETLPSEATQLRVGDLLQFTYVDSAKQQHALQVVVDVDQPELSYWKQVQRDQQAKR